MLRADADWFVPPLGLLFVVDQTPNPSGFPFFLGLIQRETTEVGVITGVINADSKVMQETDPVQFSLHGK